jgi:hypothetical protein
MVSAVGRAAVKSAGMRREAGPPRNPLAGAVLDRVLALAHGAIGIAVGLAARVLDQQDRPVAISEPCGDLLERVLSKACVTNDIEVSLRLPGGEDLSDRAGVDDRGRRGCDGTWLSSAGERRGCKQREEEQAGSEQDRAAGDFGHFSSGSPPIKLSSVQKEVMRILERFRPLEELSILCP